MNLRKRTRVSDTADQPSMIHVADHRHVVEFYDSEEFLVDTVTGFVGPALDDGDSAVIVATAAHRRAFDAGLRASGVDVSSAAASDRYLAFDAAERLKGIMLGGVPDAGRFAETVGGVIDRATAGGRRVRIYGEMVALLRDAGDSVSVIALEDLWNDLATERDFMLLCAYPMRLFQDTAGATAFRRICDQHSTVIPREDYAVGASVDAQQRVVARLQQLTVALSADVARLRVDQIVAEADHAEALAIRSRPRQAKAQSRPAPLVAPSITTGFAPASGPKSSPGGRILAQSLGTLSGRLRYADERGR